MLKGIPEILSPQLLKILCEMGHGDQIVIADGNFPAESMGKNSVVIRADGHGTTELLEAILSVFPLDTYVDNPIKLMQVVPNDNVETPIWEEYYHILANNCYQKEKVENVERFAFYEAAKRAYAIIATSENALYANLILQKGVIKIEGKQKNDLHGN
ncbi:MAG: RbsD/FucU domain-containing protein [Oscillospiraceae bacterium]